MCVASPHEIRGNIVKAFVILQDNYQGNDDLVKELQTFAKNEVAPYKTHVQLNLELIT